MSTICTPKRGFHEIAGTWWCLDLLLRHLLDTDPCGFLVGERKPGRMTLSFSEAAQVLESGQSAGPEGPNHPAILCSAPSLWNWRHVMGDKHILPQELWLSGLSLLITGNRQFLFLSWEHWRHTKQPPCQGLWAQPLQEGHLTERVEILGNTCAGMVYKFYVSVKLDGVCLPWLHF